MSHKLRGGVFRVGNHRQCGAAMIEYLVVASLLVLVLIAKPNVFTDLAAALRESYASFVYVLSAAWT